MRRRWPPGSGSFTKTLTSRALATRSATPLEQRVKITLVYVSECVSAWQNKWEMTPAAVIYDSLFWRSAVQPWNLSFIKTHNTVTNRNIFQIHRKEQYKGKNTERLKGSTGRLDGGKGGAERALNLWPREKRARFVRSLWAFRAFYRWLGLRRRRRDDAASDRKTRRNWAGKWRLIITWVDGIQTG